MINRLRDLNLKHSYDSGYDDLLWDFYIPVLSKANSYDRIAGFFSSSVLALAARGMGQFIKNNGTMRLVTCPHLMPSDIRLLESSSKDLKELLSDSFLKSMDEIEDSFARDHVKALGWMLANKRLDIRIAVLKKDGRILSKKEIEDAGIMHQKVGILYDQNGDVLTFSGSLNESASGWLHNTEEFKVFCGWEDTVGYYKDDIKRFDTFWSRSRSDVEIYTLPEAVKERLIIESKDFEPSVLDVKRYPRKNPVTEAPAEQKKTFEPFFYQKDAVEKWNRNERKLLFQMATGCGKTKTAETCMAMAAGDTKKLLMIVTTPQDTLSGQWQTDLEENAGVVVDGIEYPIPSKYSYAVKGGTGWRIDLEKEIRKLKTGLIPYLTVYVTHAIAHTEDFLALIRGSGERVTKFLIGDEVHGLGAKEMRSALSDMYDYRIGLSATPQRWFDDVGSDIIQKYFGDDSFEFTIEDALREHNTFTGKTFLVNYRYHPEFVSLTDDEMAAYKKLTDKIVRLSASGSEDFRTYLEMLRFERANIEKNAEGKYALLEKILDELGDEIDDTIIFVSPEQIDRVMQILKKRSIDAARFTKDQGTAPMEKYGGFSERQHIIKLFKEGTYKVLVAIKCLDEGIDIPSADTAIVMASSTNPREYVQRIGRIIRQAPGKTEANIYDMIIMPDYDRISEAGKEMEKRIFLKEMDRVKDLSRNAINNVQILNQVNKILLRVEQS